MLTIALSKGKLLGQTIPLLQQAGYPTEGLKEETRRLVFGYPEKGVTFLIVRPSDVPTYVEYGAADAGVVGKDVLMEQHVDVYEPVDLHVGACRISVAALKGREIGSRLSSKVRVATKYPRITERYFNQQGIPVEIIKLYGSIELAPVTGLADRIVDLVETGNTLKAHDLSEVEVIAYSTARLIVNRASLRLKHQAVTALIQSMRQLAISERARPTVRRPSRAHRAPNRPQETAR
ncbi:ATP phosphoribosyltransferase [Nitrospira sp.]|nr:ATP phosphoribosyltransferase [Nitrospira sp.]